MEEPLDMQLHCWRLQVNDPIMQQKSQMWCCDSFALCISEREILMLVSMLVRLIWDNLRHSGRLTQSRRDTGKRCQCAQNDGEAIFLEMVKDKRTCSDMVPHGDVLPTVSTRFNIAVESAHTSSRLINLNKSCVICWCSYINFGGYWRKRRFGIYSVFATAAEFKNHGLFSLAEQSLEGLVARCKYTRRVNSREGELSKSKNNVGTGTNGLKLVMNKFRVELGFSPLDEEGLFGHRRAGAELLPSMTHTWRELFE